jgi:tyrosine-protein phosphatase OCA6
MDDLYPPYRFAMVNPGVFRGSYPCLPNFRYLSRLQLKTVLSVIPEAPTQDLSEFVEMAGATSIHIPILRTAPLQESLFTSLLQVISIILDTNNHPIFIHCIDGRRVTSLIVLLLRKLQGWSAVSAFSEFWRFQVVGKSPMVTTLEVEKQTRDLERFCWDIVEYSVAIPEKYPRLVSFDLFLLCCVSLKLAEFCV